MFSDRISALRRSLKFLVKYQRNNKARKDNMENIWNFFKFYLVGVSYYQGTGHSLNDKTWQGNVNENSKIFSINILFDIHPV